MNTGIESLDQAYEILFVGALIVLALLLIGCLVRAIMGPRVADRLVAVNMMGTIVMSIIAILTVRMGEGYLADICLIYAMLSFLAVIILSKVYIGVYLEHKEHEEAKKNAANRDMDTQTAAISGAQAAGKTDTQAVVSGAKAAGKADTQAAVSCAETEMQTTDSIGIGKKVFRQQEG